MYFYVESECVPNLMTVDMEKSISYFFLTIYSVPIPFRFVKTPIDTHYHTPGVSFIFNVGK